MRRLLLKAAPALAWAATGCGGADAPPQLEAGALAPSAHSVYLNFAQGGEGVTLGSADDAPGNVSQLCASTFARWRGTRDCSERDQCARIIRELVTDYFADYDVAFTLERPPVNEHYSMLIIAPFDQACSFGRLGVAATDCGNTNPSDVAFVFDCRSSAAECAALVAHEAAHTLGLVHVADDRDLMTLAPTDPTLQFRDVLLPALPNECGITQQSSAQALRQALLTAIPR